MRTSRENTKKFLLDLKKKNAQRKERIERGIELANTECTKNEDFDLVRF